MDTRLQTSPDETEPGRGPSATPGEFQGSATAWGRAAPQTDAEGFRRRMQRLVARSLRILPKRLVKIFANRYVAGETRQQALDCARRQWEQNRLQSTLDVLGEDVRDWAHVDEYFQEYRQLVAELAPLEYANISIKLSALGQLMDEDRCVEMAEQLLVEAAQGNTFVRFDMEDHTMIDSTLRIYRRVRERHDNCGVVFQSRLFRTKGDIEALASLAPNVRLCIGIYREPPSIAMQDKASMKRHLLELLEIMWKNGQHVGIATHEEWVIRGALDLAQRLGKPDSEIEVQMLLGVPRQKLQRELVDRGITLRLYVPYGEHWYAYSMRRLENNPDVLQSVIKSMFGWLLRGG